MIRRFAIAIVVTAAALVGSQGAAAQSDPLIESLADRQAREYRLAAPTGDDPAPQPVIEVTVPTELLPANPPAAITTAISTRDEPVSLDDSAQRQVVRQDLTQFGYSLFATAPTTVSPMQGIPVPPGYRVGPGDSLVVQLWGKTNVEYRLTVTREGRLLIPEFGPLDVSGLTFEDVRQAIIEGFSSRVIGARATVSMGDLRTVQFRLTGDVTRPGLYTVSGMSTLVDALVTSGGVGFSGSLRRIELRRDGQLVTRLDLYDLLLRGDTGADVSIQHNDVIFVPPLGPVVYVGGEVQRPAIYELNGERTVGEALALAGGLLPTASLEDSHIERIENGRFRTIVDLGPERESLEGAIRDGDLLRILPVDDYMDDVVLLSGHVRRPGGYQFRAGLRIADLLGGVGSLLPGAVLDHGLIVREDRATRMSRVLWFQPGAALARPGSDVDLELEARDEVILFGAGDNRSKGQEQLIARLAAQAGTDRTPAIEFFGAVGQQGRHALPIGARLSDAVRAFGHGETDADGAYSIVARTSAQDGRTRLLTAGIDAALAAPGSDADPALEPGDRIYVFGEADDRPALLSAELDRLEREAGHHRVAPITRVNGHVRYPGRYPHVDGLRVGDLICAAGGLTRDAFGLAAEVSRPVESTGVLDGLAHEAVDVAGLVADCGSPTRSAAGPVLYPGDELTFVQKPGWQERAVVTLEGEVARPGVYPVDRDDTLCSVLERAGGLTAEAYTLGAIFTRRSVQELQQETLDAIQDQLDDLLVELSLSHSAKNLEKAPVDNDKQEYLRIIKQLDRAEASGRMVVNLDRVATCDRDADIALEDGDRLTVPRRPSYVTVAGQVYVPTSHLFDAERDIDDYIDLSGGATVLGRLSHAYVVQPNGEVVGLSNRRVSKRALRRAVAPGARIIVPLNVDRMNTTERVQSWTRSLFEAAVFAGIVL